MVLRCKECGEVIEVTTQSSEGERPYTRAKVPVCPDCAAWAWELCGEDDEEETL